MASSLLFRLFLKAYRNEILREAYVGILGREPDAPGLTTHAESIEQKGELASVLAEMSQSKEAWDCALRAHAEPIVRQLCETLREGEADASDLDGWTAHLHATADVAAAAGSVARGPAHWRKLVREDPGILIDAAFNALLKRQPDLDGLTTYTKLLNRTGDVTAFLADLSESEESRARSLRQTGLASGAELTRSTVPTISFEMLVTEAYRGLLGREPDADGLAAYTKLLEEGGDVAEFIASLDQSPEHRKRLLLRRA